MESNSAIIESDDIVIVNKSKTETEQFQEKKRHYEVCQDSTLQLPDLLHAYNSGRSSMFDTSGGNTSDGLLPKMILVTLPPQVWLGSAANAYEFCIDFLYENGAIS